VTPLSAELLARLRAVAELRVWPGAPLSPFTTFGSGGRAKVLLTPGDPESLVEALAILREAGMSWVVLGAGSNVLVADQGYPGAVISLGSEFAYLQEDYPHSALVVGAGLSLPRLAVQAADRGLSGLEFTCGIPGSVGGAVAMNAGAHGSNLEQVVTDVQIADAEGLRRVDGGELEWHYRRCGLPADAVVTAVRLELVAAERQEILIRHRTFQQARRRTQPRGVRNFGSTFKNPEGEAAGRLLEAAGLKGIRRGGAQISSVHANFVTNVDEASTRDALDLMTIMRESVWAKHRIALDPEVRLLGAVFPWQRAADQARAGDQAR